MPQTLLIRDLDLQDYQPVWQAMQKFVDERTPTTIDELWLLEHSPVFTLGQAGDPSHILSHSDIPIIHVDRGGQVTYHGPGQLIAYCLFDIKRLNLGVRDFVRAIEQVLLDLLAIYDLKANLKEGAPGVYIEDKKIASLGLRIRQGYSYHGLSFNLNMDLKPFLQINPCGQTKLVMTQLHDYRPTIVMSDIKTELVTLMAKQFDFQVEKGPNSL